MALLPGTMNTEAVPPEEEQAVHRKGKVWVNVTPDEEMMLEAWAARSGKPLAVMVREAALAAATSSR